MRRREIKGKGERRKHTQLNAEFQRIARKEKSTLLNKQCNEIEEKKKMGNTIDLMKIGDIKGTFHERMGMIKDRSNKDLTEYKRLTKYRKSKQKNYTKKGLNNSDNQDGVVTHLDPDILECEVKNAL